MSGRRAAAIVLALGLIGVAWGALAESEPEVHDACLSSDHAMRRLWSPQVEIGVRPQDIETLDVYAERWSWVWVDRCRADQGRGRTFDTRSNIARCLSWRADLFRAAVELLKTPDPPSGVADALPPVDECLDRTHLLYQPSLPDSPGRLAPALVARAELARVKILALTARDRARDALPAAEAAVTSARHPPLRAELEAIALMLLDTDELRVQRERLYAAVELAEELGNDPLAARLLVLQLRITDDHAAARVLERLAQGKITRTGDQRAAQALDRWRRGN